MLNEERTIAAHAGAIAVGAPDAEVIVVDGASSDRSRDQARPRCALLLVAPRGLARQMNAGAAAAHGDALVFVHADTLVPPTFARDISSRSDAAVVADRLICVFTTARRSLRLIGWPINTRSRLSARARATRRSAVRRRFFFRPARRLSQH